MIKCLHCACEPNLLPCLPDWQLSDVDEEGQKREGDEPPPSSGLPSPASDEANSGITVRTDAGVLIVVDRSRKQCLCAAESGGVSLRVKGRGFTQATLVDNPLAALKAWPCNLGC